VISPPRSPFLPCSSPPTVSLQLPNPRQVLFAATFFTFAALGFLDCATATDAGSPVEPLSARVRASELPSVRQRRTFPSRVSFFFFPFRSFRKVRSQGIVLPLEPTPCNASLFFPPPLSHPTPCLTNFSHPSPFRSLSFSFPPPTSPSFPLIVHFLVAEPPPSQGFPPTPASHRIFLTSPSPCS